MASSSIFTDSTKRTTAALAAAYTAVEGLLIQPLMLPMTPAKKSSFPRMRS